MITCPKCKATSGDSWKQCGGKCPMPMSPHYVGKDCNSVGTAFTGNGPTVRAIYVGDVDALRWKTALVIFSGETAAAQFDDVTTGYGYGWHDFRPRDFAMPASASQ